MVAVEQKKIETLCTWDDEYMSLEKEYQKKWVQLQQEYETKQQVWIEKRKEYLSGEGKIEKFWLKALQNFPALEDEIKEHDEEVLAYVTDIRKEDLPDESGLNQTGFKIIFEFAENPFLENQTLVREFHTVCESDYVNENTISHLKMEKEVKWKSGKDVTVHKVTKKKKGKKAQGSTTVEEPRPSFFRTFFRTINLETQEPEELMDLIQMQMQDEEMEHDEDSEREFLEMIKEEALAHGVVIKDNIIPFAVRWYTGEALPEMFDGGDDEEEEYEDGEELGVEGVSSDDEEGDKKKSNKKKAKGGDLFKADKGSANIFAGAEEKGLFAAEK